MGASGHEQLYNCTLPFETRDPGRFSSSRRILWQISRNSCTQATKLSFLLFAWFLAQLALLVCRLRSPLPVSNASAGIDNAWAEDSARNSLLTPAQRIIQDALPGLTSFADSNLEPLWTLTPLPERAKCQGFGWVPRARLALRSAPSLARSSASLREQFLLNGPSFVVSI